MVDQSQLDQDLDYLRIGREEGAELLCGGETLERENPGFYLSPALFAETNNEMRITREEIFGPVASVIKASGFDEAWPLRMILNSACLRESARDAARRIFIQKRHPAGDGNG